jgi:hypothetical protein
MSYITNGHQSQSPVGNKNQRVEQIRTSKYSIAFMLVFHKFCGRYNDLLYNYKLLLSHMLPDIFETNSLTVNGTLTLTADNSAFMIMELGSRRVWLVDRGCLLFLGTWSYLRYIRGSVLAHWFLWFVILTCVSRLITLWYLSHFIIGGIRCLGEVNIPCLPVIPAVSHVFQIRRTVWSVVKISVQRRA